MSHRLRTGEAIEAQFVFKAWLDAGGERQLVQPFLTPWLNAHRQSLEASFLFPAWLDARGEPALIQNDLSVWLEAYADYEEADHVYRAWLKAGGDFDFVREPACRWLSVHRASADAVFLTKYLAKQNDLPKSTVSDILFWCQTFHQNQDALWRFTSLKNHLLRTELSEEIVATASSLLRAIFKEKYITATTSSLLSTLFAKLGESPLLRTKTKPLFLRWLRHPASYSVLQTLVNQQSQKLSTLLYLRDLLKSGDLSLDNDRESLLKFFAWTGTWEPEAQARVRPFLESLVKTAGRVPLEYEVPFVDQDLETSSE